MKFPIGIQSFEVIRKEGFVYVDKTDIIHRLAQGLYFHYTFYLLMRLISCYTVYTEKQLSEGRADCIVEEWKVLQH